jgi:tetratricopeptide (TPR) repeat protein
MNIFKRKFDSSIQKNREPIKDPEGFKHLQFEFSLHWGKYMQDLMKLVDNSQEAINALEIADEMIKMEPRRGVPWTCRCIALGALKRFPEALEANKHAIEIDPSDPDKWDLHSNILKSLGKMDESKKAAKKAEELRKM